MHTTEEMWENVWSWFGFVTFEVCFIYFYFAFVTSETITGYIGSTEVVDIFKNELGWKLFDYDKVLLFLYLYLPSTFYQLILLVAFTQYLMF